MNIQTSRSFLKRITLSIALTSFLMTPASAAIEYSATSFNLVDEKGRVTAQLSSSAEGTPSLFFFDENNVVRLNLGIYPGGNPGIVLMDKNGKSAAVITLSEDGITPSVSLRKDGEEKNVLGIDANDSAASNQENSVAPTEMTTSKMKAETEKRKEYLLYLSAFLFGVIGAYIGGRLAIRKDNRVTKVTPLTSAERDKNDLSS
jgi:hypothetical protein